VTSISHWPTSHSYNPNFCLRSGSGSSAWSIRENELAIESGAREPAVCVAFMVRPFQWWIAFSLNLLCRGISRTTKSRIAMVLWRHERQPCRHKLRQGLHRLLEFLVGDSVNLPTQPTQNAPAPFYSFRKHKALFGIQTGYFVFSLNLWLSLARSVRW
jgi:hypothetical protein